MRSIRQQLTRKLVAAILVLLGGGLLAVYLAAREALFEQFDTALRAKALAVSTVTRAGRDGIEVEFSDRFFRGFDDDRPRDFYQVWDASGNTLARSESLQKRADLPLRFGRRDKPVRWNLTLPTDRPGRALGFAFTPRSNGSRGGSDEVRLVVASDREDLDETLWHLLGLALGCGALLLGASLWLIPRVLRTGLRPLEDLGDRAGQIQASSLATRFPTEGLPSELQPIARRLNDLLGRLETSFERERRFSADLAHELRTPLAELRSAAECALKWPEARDASLDRETLAVAQQMETLVTQMLALARGEHARLSANLAPVALDVLVRDVWQRCEPFARDRSLNVTLQLEPSTVNADAVLLRSIITNLLDNATSYAPRADNLNVTLEHVGDRVLLHVANSAPDLQDDEVERMFDRFWRKETARTGGSHSGLGLSVARAFAQAMDWTLTARLDPARRLVVTLSSAASRPQN